MNKVVRIIKREEAVTRKVVRAYIQLPKSLIEEIEREVKEFIGIKDIGKIESITIRTSDGLSCTLYVEVEEKRGET